MSPHREHVFRGDVRSEHQVQLFDEPQSLVAALADFVEEGWRHGHALLIVARPASWALTTPELEIRGCPVSELIATSRLVVLDAATTLATVMVKGVPDQDQFEASVGDLVRLLRARSEAGLTVYGEMVDILVGQGNFQGAERLERLWNSLAEHCSFRLLCGYTAAHFGDEQNGPHLQRICGLHGSASARATDLLSTWLLANRRPRYHLDKQ